MTELEHTRDDSSMVCKSPNKTNGSKDEQNL